MITDIEAFKREHAVIATAIAMVDYFNGSWKIITIFALSNIKYQNYDTQSKDRQSNSKDT